MLIILIVLIIGSGAFLAWQFLRGSNPSTPTAEASPIPNSKITLNFWGVFDNPAIFKPIIDAYKVKHPNVTVVYTSHDSSLYEFSSLNQLAEQSQGPDVWMIPLEWLPKHRDKFRPLPEGFLAQQNLAPAPKPRFSLFAKSSPAPSNKDLYSKVFVPMTAEENVVNGSVYTVPLSLDTLGVYANTAALQSVGAQGVPQTWEEIIDLTKKLTKRSALTINQPAIGLGTSNNISRANDILATMLLQNHTPMISNDKQEALYNRNVTKATGETVQPGSLALDFYTSFASPTKETYTWNQTLPNDFELFANGSLPLMIDYSYRVRDLVGQHPNLAFSTGIMPQIEGTLPDAQATLGTAMMVGVTKASKQSLVAADFVKFLSSKEQSLAYDHASGRPPARIDLLSDTAGTSQTFDAHLLPFIAQAGIAKPWYRNEINKVNEVFTDGINATLSGEPLTQVIDRITKQVTHILRNEPYK